MVWEGEVHTWKWIRWTKEREEELIRLYVQAKPANIGYMCRFQSLWNVKFPDLVTTSTALTRRLYVIRNRPTEPVAQQDETQNRLEGVSMVGYKVRISELNYVFPPQIPADIRKSFELEWHKVQTIEEGDLTSREKLMFRSKPPQANVLNDLDQLMIEK